MARLLLKGSVGRGRSRRGIPHNDSEDFAAVKARLVELGYDWVKPITRADHSDFIDCIRLFQASCAGKWGTINRIAAADGRIGRGGWTHRWLAAQNAPGWVQIHGRGSLSWEKVHHRMYKPTTAKNNGGYCTTWLYDRIHAVGREYYRTHMSRHMDAPPIWVMDCSPSRGGNARGHGSHETGIDVDMRLPLRAPHENKWDDLGRKGYDDPRFDRAAAEAQLKAIKKFMEPQLVLFNDPEFRRKGLCSRDKKGSHDQHFHIRIKVPTRIEGQIH